MYCGVRYGLAHLAQTLTSVFILSKTESLLSCFGKKGMIFNAKP